MTSDRYSNLDLVSCGAGAYLSAVILTPSIDLSLIGQNKCVIRTAGDVNNSFAQQIG